MAGVSYATLWLAYAQFYLQLGTTPEEAGIDKTDLLTQALVGPSVFFIGLFAIVFIYSFSAAILAGLYAVFFRDLFAGAQTLVARIRKKKAPLPPRSGRGRAKASRLEFVQTFVKGIRRPKRIVVVAAPLAFSLLCVVLYSESAEAGRKARDGVAVAHPSLSFGTFSLPLVGIRAAPVTIHWNDDAPAAFRKGGLTSVCLMHVGEADGKTLLYNVRFGSLIRLPSDDAVFELRTDSKLPRVCLDEASW